MAEPFTTISYARFILFLSVTISLVVMAIISIQGIQEDSIRLLIRWSVRLGGILFAIAFSASAFHKVLNRKWTGVVLKNRAYFGLSFATFHTFHLIFLMWLQLSIHPVFELAKSTSLIGGGIAYLMMYLMVITTFPERRRKLSPGQWKVLHTIGGYWIWIIFFRSYLRNYINHDRYLLLLVLFTLVIIVRGLALIKYSGSKKVPNWDGDDKSSNFEN